jgi:hypothetical protein
VDDFSHAGNTEFEAMMGKLKQRFLAGKVGEHDFYYIGFHIRQKLKIQMELP